MVRDMATAAPPIPLALSALRSQPAEASQNFVPAPLLYLSILLPRGLIISADICGSPSPLAGSGLGSEPSN